MGLPVGIDDDDSLASLGKLVACQFKSFVEFSSCLGFFPGFFEDRITVFGSFSAFTLLVVLDAALAVNLAVPLFVFPCKIGQSTFREI